MRNAVAAVLASIGLFFAGTDSRACTPIEFGGAELIPPVIAEEMVASAATIELMRIESRTAVRAHPVYTDIYATPIYAFQFESVEVLKGRTRGDLVLHGPGADGRFRGLPEQAMIRREPLWWAGPDGFEALHWTSLLDPADSGSIACRDPLNFELGATYLIFRDAYGSLMAPAYSWTRQRPVVEIVRNDDDLWLGDVRAAISRRGEGPDTFWTALFQIIFGNRRANE